MYESGISISARMLLLIAMAALWIWLEESRLCFKCFLDFSERPPGGTHGIGNHHFSSFRWTITLRNDPEPEWFEFDDMLPFSAYQNSVSWKLSSTSCQKKKQTNSLTYLGLDWNRIAFLQEKKLGTLNWSYNKHCIKLLQSWKVDIEIRSRSACHQLKEQHTKCQKQTPVAETNWTFCHGFLTVTSISVPSCKFWDMGMSSTM